MYVGLHFNPGPRSTWALARPPPPWTPNAPSEDSESSVQSTGFRRPGWWEDFSVSVRAAVDPKG